MPFRNGLRSARTILLVLLSVSFSSTWLFAESDDQVPLSIRADGIWTVVESPNFVCRSRLPLEDARRLAMSCEAWRTRLRKAWISQPEVANWVPKCTVQVHTDQIAYNHALNRPGDSSVGSTMMNFDQQRTTLRRIDVRADAKDWSNAALPHELTHVVLGERFGGHALPRWADEGIAMLSESAEKQEVRLSNLRTLLSNRLTMGMGELVRTTRMPAPQYRDAFYGQSIALTSLLVRRSSPARFADFIEDAQRRGLDAALTTHYQVAGVAGLETEWNEWIRSPQSIEFISLELHLGLTPIVASTSNR